VEPSEPPEKALQKAMRCVKKKLTPAPDAEKPKKTDNTGIPRAEILKQINKNK